MFLMSPMNCIKDFCGRFRYFVLVVFVASTKTCNHAHVIDCGLVIKGPPRTQSGGGIDMERRNLTSPNFPMAFPNATYNCTYLFDNDDNSFVKLVFTDFLLESFSHSQGDQCRNLLLFEDLITGTKKIYCGNNRPPALRSQGQKTQLTFIVTDNDAEATGFQMFYFYDEKPYWNEKPLISSDIRTDSGGPLIFMNPFLNDGLMVDVTWIVVGKTGTKISLRIDNSTLCVESHSEIYLRDGATSVSTLIASKNEILKDPRADYTSQSYMMFIELRNKVFENDFLLATYTQFAVIDEYTGTCPGDNLFKCMNKRCIDMNLVCDDRDHCSDGSDESFCAQDCRHVGCQNGGTCDSRSGRCDCVSGSYGKLCDMEVEDVYNYEEVIIIGVISATVCLLSLLVCCLYMAWNPNKRSGTGERLRSLGHRINADFERDPSPPPESQQPTMEEIEMAFMEFIGRDAVRIEPPRTLEPPPYDAADPPAYVTPTTGGSVHAMTIQGSEDGPNGRIMSNDVSENLPPVDGGDCSTDDHVVNQTSNTHLRSPVPFEIQSPNNDRQDDVILREGPLVCEACQNCFVLQPDDMGRDTVTFVGDVENGRRSCSASRVNSEELFRYPIAAAQVAAPPPVVHLHTARVVDAGIADVQTEVDGHVDEVNNNANVGKVDGSRSSQPATLEVENSDTNNNFGLSRFVFNLDDYTEIHI